MQEARSGLQIRMVLNSLDSIINVFRALMKCCLISRVFTLMLSLAEQAIDEMRRIKDLDLAQFQTVGDVPDSLSC